MVLEVARRQFTTAEYARMVEAGVPYIVINRGATDHDHEPSVSLPIEGDVAEIFPAAVEAALA